MTVSEIGELAADRLPKKYEPLKLTFYGREVRFNRNYAVIGDDYGTDFCVDVSDGAIYSIDPEEKLPIRFVNSSIEQLAKFIKACEAFSERTKDEANTLLWKELKSIDPKAFSAPDNWWATILEQVQQGSL